MRERPWQSKPRAQRRDGARRDHNRPHWNRPSARRERDAPIILYGWHTVTAALANPARRIRKLWATENAVRRLADEGIALPIEPELVRPDAIAARLSPDAVHQGLLAEADPLAAPELDELTAAGIVLVLDQITDPHNFRGDLAHRSGVRGRSDCHHCPSQPGGDRRARQIRIGRA